MDDDVRLRRRLTAVLLADVVGYSRLMSADEEGTHLRLTGYVQSLIDPAVAKHRGRLIRSMGDGMLVEFDSALDAVRCGIDIQRGLAEREQQNSAGRIQLRIGINTGDVIVDERDIYGNSINIAARLEGLAEPGQIYVTRGVRDQLRGYPDISFEDKGERRVKNIDRPIRVFRVASDERPRAKSAVHNLLALACRPLRPILQCGPRATWLAAGMLLAGLAVLGMTVPPAWFRTVALPPRNSIVVMPFNNFSSDPRQGYVADAITDDVTTDLARLKGIFVIARGTAFTFKGRSVDAREVGKECGVRYLLEGSIIRDGTRLETNVQLVDTETGAHLWADRFVSDMGDLFKLLSAVTGRIAASIDIQLPKAEGERVLQQPVADPDAVDLRLQAMALYISGITPEHTLAARRLLEQSVHLDANSAESWAWLADVLASDYLNQWNGAGAMQLSQADDAARKALALDPELALAYYVRGFVYRAHGKNSAALNAFDEALVLNPNFARAYAQRANELINVGRPREAPPLVRTAIALSPLDPSIGIWHWILGRSYFFADNYEESTHWLRQSVDERPTVWFNRLYLVSALALSGRTAEAHSSLSDFNVRFRDYSIARISLREREIPNNNPFIIAGLEKFHNGLRVAGMPERQ